MAKWGETACQRALSEDALQIARVHRYIRLTHPDIPVQEMLESRKLLTPSLITL